MPIKHLTPLEEACSHNDIKEVEKLLSAWEVTTNDDLPLYFARYHKNKKMARLLVTKGATLDMNHDFDRQVMIEIRRDIASCKDLFQRDLFEYEIFPKI